MADISSWQSAIEQSDHLSYPDRVATNLYMCSVKILHEFITNGEEAFEPNVLEALDYQDQRLRLWGSNFNAKEGGLDERLIGADRMKGVLLPLLLRMAEILANMAYVIDLDKVLEDLCLLIKELRMQVLDMVDGAINEEETSQGSFGLTISSSPTDESSSSGSDHSSFTEPSKLEELTEDLEFHIDLIYRLASTLYDNAENTSKNPDNRKIGPIVDQSHHNFLQDTAWPLIKNILDAHPSIQTNLARRLGKANEIRYNRLKDARDEAAAHASNLETENSSDEVEELEQLFPSQARHDMTQAASEFTAPSTKFSSIFDRSQAPPLTKNRTALQYAASVTSFAPSTIGDGSSNQKRGIPKFPRELALNESFDCMICGTRLSMISNKDEWKKHVYQDLKPYICTFDDCDHELEPFLSQHQWVDHEFSKHRKMPDWNCDICSLKISKELSIRVHISEEHGHLDDLRLDLLRESCSQHVQQWMREQSCPFCSLFIANTKREFRSHVGRHLEEVSHAAIPPSALGYEAQDTEAVEDDISEVTGTLEDRYARILLNIAPNYVSYTRAMLQWLCFCSRPMRLEELVEATAVDQGDRNNIEDPKPEDILQLCGEMVVNQAGTWKCHQSIRQYLISDLALTPYHMIDTSANGSIAKACLIYMLRSPRQQLQQLQQLPREQAFRQYPLLEYAMREWPGHYRKAWGHQDHKDMDEIAYQLVTDKPLFNIWLQWSDLVYYKEEDMACPAVYHMSFFGISGVVAKLLETGTSPDAQPEGHYGYALGAACHSGHQEVVSLLIDSGANVNQACSDETHGSALEAACRNGHQEVVRLLLEAGADANVHGGDKSITPLHTAAVLDDEETVQLLLQYGADPDSCDSFSETPLHYAAERGAEGSSQVLLAAGADINAANSSGLTPFDVALPPSTLSPEDSAIYHRRKRVIKQLFAYGFDVDALYEKHGTRLQQAARSGNERAVRILLQGGADANLFRVPVPWPRYVPGSPLQEAIGISNAGTRAAESGNEKIVRMLLDHGADVNFRGEGSVGTPLQWAAGAGNVRIVELLLDAGADVHDFASHEESAVATATISGREKVVRLLLDRGADPNRSNGLSALTWASRKKFTAIEKMLREHGAVE